MTPSPTPEPFWRRTPPALLPVCLGLTGVGLAWRGAATTLGAPAAIGELWLGLATAALAYCLFLYARKVLARPGTLAFDIRMPAGRGAVSAGTMALMLTGAALAPFAPAPATVVWGAGVLAHGLLAALLVKELMGLPPEGRPATPALYVPFVGQIVAPIGGVALGFPMISSALFWLAVAVWAALTPFVLRRLARARDLPPPMRPGFFILLGPPAAALAAHDALDPESRLDVAFFALACVALFGLLSRIAWLTRGGWTPAWGAFTFPSAAFAGACLVMAERQDGRIWDLAAAVSVAAASLVVLYVAWRTVEAWAKGRLAPAGR